MAVSDAAYRLKLLQRISNKRDTEEAFVRFVDDFQDKIVSKRLILGESIVDTSQPSLIKVTKACLSSTNEEALKELYRFELGPISNSLNILSSCEKEKLILQEQISQIENTISTTLVDIDRLKRELQEAKTYPKEKVESMAKECQSLPSNSQLQAEKESIKIEIKKLEEEKLKLKDAVEKRKQSITRLAQVLEQVREEASATKLDS